MGNAIFRPVRGTEEAIRKMPKEDGYIYYAYDSGRIYMDKDNERIPMGGGSGTANGASIYYGEYGQIIEENEETKKYDYPKNALENKKAVPKEDDIILDDNGALYRILIIGDEYFECELLPLSGDGTSSIKRPSLTLHTIENPILVNGQPFEINFTVKSALDENDQPLAEEFTIYWSLIDEDTKQVYYNGTPKTKVKHNQMDSLVLGDYLKFNTNTIIRLYATGINHDEASSTREASVSTVEMYLQQTSDYNPINTYTEGKTVLYCNAVGNLSKILKWSVDGTVLKTEYLNSNDTNPREFEIPESYSKHGYHTVLVELCQNLGNETSPKEGLSANPLQYEIAIVKEGDSNQPPIIWLGDYKNSYYNYETIQIPYMVYNPTNTSMAEIHLYKNEIGDENELEGSPVTIKDFTKFSYWQIADAELNKDNQYALGCYYTKDGKQAIVERTINFKVVKDPKRPMEIMKQNNLKLNFDPIGRSNSEPSEKRATWSYINEEGNKIYAKFDNFNWYNNGWFVDSEAKNSYLRISNGAKFTIPFNKLGFGTSNTSSQSNAIEISLKMRNIQDYSNLITNITRYKNDDEYYNAFIAPEQTEFSNYDAYLQATLSAEIYENLEFLRVQKNINLNNVACGFYSGNNDSAVGFCVGPQDTFFSNGTDTVSVSFVENEIINLSFVYDHTLKLIYIYINGCITGVIESTITGDTGFIINTNEIVFDSSICDIDLYKIRIYNTSLNVNDIVTNYAVDKKDVLTYDQNFLATENNTLKEYQLSFKNVEEYNKQHPEQPLMPYIIFDTTETANDKLPYAKINKEMPIKIEFVNAPLDAAYARGELIQKAIDDGLLRETETNQTVIDEAVRTYYTHNCPSWTSTMSAGDQVTIQVQGTSSEFYPRRNFKVKTKYKKDDKSKFCCWDDSVVNEDGTTGAYTKDSCLNIFMHKGPFENIFNDDQKRLDADKQKYYGWEESRMSDGWYMNNYTNPTDRWTLKIDYMESSGSYNAGFASLVANAYTKHPLQDYLSVLTNTDDLKSSVYNEMRWNDYRTSLLGFPIMAFQKRKKRIYRQNSEGKWIGVPVEPIEYEYIFIGYYRMLLDKGSDQVMGFKTPKKIKHKLLNDQKLRDVAECWEFSTNARTFCSYKDPWNRVELSFKGPKSEGDNIFIKLDSGNIGGPVVLNHFEPRYFWAEDYLKNDEDGFYNFGNLSQEKVTEICEELGINNIDITNENAKYQAQDAAVKLMENWEKVCKWVYSTNLDNVKSQGEYINIELYQYEYEPNKFYILQKDENGEDEYILDSSIEFNAEQTYYEQLIDDKGNISYIIAFVNISSNAENKKKYEANKYYIQVSGAYSLCTEEQFDSSLVYYEFTSYSNEQIEENKIADRLIEPATVFDSSLTYYTYNPDAKVISGGGATEAIKIVQTPNEEDFIAGKYYVGKTVKYGNTEYKYDTKEYRTAKFINELTKHFDPEYLATYFIMTEVFECYDSRGKNCMMASWGPKEENGEYIWYPIFYDIDTQLGINNTGIPSFEFNVDATEKGNYSTSDSILWNNFYKFFKGSYILNKYKNLRGQSSSFSALNNPPLQSVDYLEKWYKFDDAEEITGNIANRGKRPLIATNLDMYFKYITITNENAPLQGVAYLLGTSGDYAVDTDCSYFYALQGDRSYSRRQFLTNRLEYIDSWLNQGNYARGGSNRIRGRISANSIGSNPVTSDIYIETEESPYWKDNKEFTTKTHDFDAQYWLTLKPIRSSYVTAGDDSANYPSQKYDGKNVVNFKLNDIETGIRRSENYPEQLVYIYGMNQMADYGEMNKLYWREFYMEGQANHLTKLQLGYDGYSKTDKKDDGSDFYWFNNELNGIALSEMPLLKEANFSGLGLKTETTLNLTKSEKLENFRAVRTHKLNDVKFADGVALNTLYLPSSVTSLKLVQANLLNNLIETKEPPSPINNEDGTVTPPEQGLFIEGYFGDTFSSSIKNIYLDGGNLGYGSYKLLKRLYDATEDRVSADTIIRKITMREVNWCPYIQVTEGAEYEPVKYSYYIDNGHYGFDIWMPGSDELNEFNNLVLNGKLYIYKQNEEQNIINDEFVTVLNNLYDKGIYADASSTEIHPNISGIVYINNTNSIEESAISEELQKKYPNLTFFFANVDKAFSAEFLFRNPDTGIDEYVKHIDGSKLPSIQKISKADYDKDNTVFFANPFGLYEPQRNHYDFIGWSTDPAATADSQELITEDNKKWDTLQIIQIDSELQYDYKYYAIFKKHSYEVTFFDGDGTILETKTIEYGTSGIEAPLSVPYKDDSTLELTQTYSFIGYTDNPLTNTLVDLSMVTVRGKILYYPVFEEISVYDNVHPEYFTIITEGAQRGAIGFNWKSGIKVRGKLTIPYELYSESAKELISVRGIQQDGFRYTSKTPNTLGVTHIFWGSNPKEDVISKLNREPSYEFIGLGATHLGYEQANSCFYGLTNLQYFEMPSTITIISQDCFKGCSNLFNNNYSDLSSTDCYIDTFFNNIEIIQQGAFTNSGLQNVELGRNLVSIGNAAFRTLRGSNDKTVIIHSEVLDFEECGTGIFEPTQLFKVTVKMPRNIIYQHDWISKFTSQPDRYVVELEQLE